jgi:hypothetical protein
MSVETHTRRTTESPEIATSHVLLTGLGALVLLFGSIWVLDAIYINNVPIRTMPPPQQFPPPAIGMNDRAELRQLREAQRKQLTEYRWIDDAHRLAQIPIDRAMQIIAHKGADAYSPLIASSALSGPTAGAERTMTPPDGSQGDPAPQGQPRTTTGEGELPAKSPVPAAPPARKEPAKNPAGPKP